MAGAHRFPLRYGAVSKPLLTVLGSGPGRSGVVLDDADLAITMGVSFAGRCPRRSVTSARTLAETVVSRGVHGWGGDWLVNGAGDGLVELAFEPPLKARVLAFPVAVRRLRLSVEDPDGLVDSIGAAAEGSGG
jgi:hypothetical protein